MTGFGVFEACDLLGRTILSVIGLMAFSVSSAFGEICETLREGPTARVVAIADGDTLDLETGLTVRLVGIQAPKLPLGREGFEPWPLGDEAKAALSDLALGKMATLYYGDETRDRHGRALAHVLVAGEDGSVWAQQALLEMGLARVYSFPDNRQCIAQMYKAERIGRVERRGIWRHPFYAIRDGADHDALLEHVGGFELVEGRVLNAALAGGRIYLNFGRYWKEDFTVVIEAAGQRVFERDGIDPLALENQVIRVRGWLDELDGPRILVTHPEQIELLGAQ
ncbi:thermonuclease family protein [Pelagibacterium lentulum]|uniref:TNase-like domain-containing protein n=1 Tax=Pelagibacterium lentulum TaxID=2029865 RepID=A0A916VU38_9HYPH|nr:thermonuclease family protein [Pelagibacterium lentulum]GGA35187.1 hypothetical protein GCM10011499_00600 [Pelagibacterium lentulum]